MQIVKQKAKYDCGVACLAMMLDKPYEEILNHFPKHDFNKEGLYTSELFSVIESYGLEVFTNHGLHLKSKGILFVPSLNTIGNFHFIYYDGPGKLFDPANNNQYTIDTFPTVIYHLLILDKRNKTDLIAKYTEILNSLNV